MFPQGIAMAGVLLVVSGCFSYPWCCRGDLPAVPELLPVLAHGTEPDQGTDQLHPCQQQHSHSSECLLEKGSYPSQPPETLLRVMGKARNPCYEHKTIGTFPRGELGSQGRAGGVGSSDVCSAGSLRGWGRWAEIWPFPLWAPWAAQLRLSRFSMHSPGGLGCRMKPCSVSPRPHVPAC